MDHSTPPTASTTAPLTDDHLRCDVVVVGSRVAGATTALLLARAGHDVVLVDRATFPSDTLSTHAIARGGVVQLNRLGVLDDLLAMGTPPVRTVSFHRGDDRVERTVKCVAGVDHLVAPRRHRLDPLLVAHARAAGVRVHHGVTVRDVVVDDRGRVSGVTATGDDGSGVRITARHVVGADGVRSGIARRVGARMLDVRPSDGATSYFYVADLPGEGFEYHVAPGAFSGVFRTDDDESCVWTCGPAATTEGVRSSQDRAGALVDHLSDVAPDLHRRLAGARVRSAVRSAVRFPNHVRSAAGHGWWLVGDAGYHRDPVTGHGITDALRDAELLAVAIDAALRGHDEADAACRYEQQRRAALEGIFAITCEMATYPPPDRFVALQRRLSGVIEAEATALDARGPLTGAVTPSDHLLQGAP